MKYSDHYKSLMFVSEGEKDMSFVDFLTRLRDGCNFKVRFIDSRDPEESDRIDFTAKTFYVKIISILTGNRLSIRITILTACPDGVVPGMYDLEFNSSIYCDDLPPEMFEDGEVEEEEPT